MIKGNGSASAKIIFVSDYPQPDEVQKEYAITGSSEYLLKEMCRDAGIAWDETYKTLFCKEYLPRPNKYQQKKILGYIHDKIPDNKFITILHREIDAIRPNVIVAVGEAAFQALTDQENINKWQGSIVPVSDKGLGIIKKRTIRVIPIRHPRDIFALYESKAYTTVYLKRAARYQNVETIPSQDFTLWTCRSYKELYNYFDRNKNPDFCTSDIETYLYFITCISFCCSDKEAVSVPLLDSRMNNVERGLMWRLIRDYYASGVPIVNQNIFFDDNFTRRWGLPIKNIHDDTLLLGKTIYPELPGRLDFYQSLYTDVPYHKDDGKEVSQKDLKQLDRLYIYNAEDALVTRLIYKAQVQDAKELKIWDFYRKGPYRFFFLHRKMSHTGIRVDDTKRKYLIETYSAILAKFRENLKGITGEDINVDAHGKVGRLLYEDMEIPARTHLTPKGSRAYSTDENTLKDLVLNVLTNESVKEAVKLIIYIRKMQNLLQFLHAVVHPDGRLRTTYKPFGTDSGRSSTSYYLDMCYDITADDKIVAQKTGLPFQTIPKRGFELIGSTETIGKDLRSMFVPSPGKVFFSGDLKNAEAIVVGILAKDEALLEKIYTGDVHRWTAALVTGKEEKDITPFEREKKGKRTRHAGHYDMKYKTLSINAGISQNEAKLVLNRFHQEDPNIQRVFHTEVKEFVRKFAWLNNYFGRRRDFFSRKDDSVFRVAYSYIPQSTVSDIMKFGMVEMEDILGDKITFLEEAHDGYMGETKPEYLGEVHAKAKSIFEKRVNCMQCCIPRDYQMKIPLERSWSDKNWAELEEID